MIRHPWDPVVLTTLPQVICSLMAPYPYSVIIAASSISTTIWHLEHEPMNILFWIDYSCAFVWRFYDIIHLGAHGYLLNMIAIATYIMASKATVPHERAQALWNLFACILTVYKVDLLWHAHQKYFEGSR
jgi:hypothetical protein